MAGFPATSTLTLDQLLKPDVASLWANATITSPNRKVHVGQLECVDLGKFHNGGDDDDMLLLLTGWLGSMCLWKFSVVQVAAEWKDEVMQPQPFKKRLQDSKTTIVESTWIFCLACQWLCLRAFCNHCNYCTYTVVTVVTLSTIVECCNSVVFLFRINIVHNTSHWKKQSIMGGIIGIPHMEEMCCFNVNGKLQPNQRLWRHHSVYLF